MAAQRTGRREAKLLLLCLLPALVGCQTVGGGWTETSAMSDSNNRQRDSILVQAVPITRSVAYRSFNRCTYRQLYRPMTGAPIAANVAYSVRPVRDRLLVTITDGRQTSTALIAANGALSDFNLTTFDGRRITSENYDAQARREIAGNRGATRVINEFTAIFPLLQPAPWNVGDVVSQIYSEDGKEWARYIYRGTASYAGEEGAVLDLAQAYDDGRQARLIRVGFTILDLDTLAPLLFILEAGAELRLERTGCG